MRGALVLALVAMLINGCGGDMHTSGKDDAGTDAGWSEDASVDATNDAFFNVEPGSWEWMDEALDAGNRGRRASWPAAFFIRAKPNEPGLYQSSNNGGSTWVAWVPSDDDLAATNWLAFASP